MKRVAERRHQMQISAWREHAAQFPATRMRVAHVLQHRIAFHALEDRVAERQLLRIGGDIHARHREEIQIDVSGDVRPAPPM